VEKLRKFFWIVIFVGILLNGCVVLFPNVPQKDKQTAAIWAIFQGLYCYITFDRVWGKKEDEKNENV
jgi:hypothetical protein